MWVFLISSASTVSKYLDFAAWHNFLIEIDFNYPNKRIKSMPQSIYCSLRSLNTLLNQSAQAQIFRNLAFHFLHYYWRYTWMIFKTKILRKKKVHFVYFHLDNNSMIASTKCTIDHVRFVMCRIGSVLLSASKSEANIVWKRDATYREEQKKCNNTRQN